MIKAGAIDEKHFVLDIEKVCQIFKAGNKFQCLSAMNLKGGKGLIPMFKELCKTTNTRNDFITTLTGEQLMFELEFNTEDFNKLKKAGIENNG